MLMVIKPRKVKSYNIMSHQSIYNLKISAFTSPAPIPKAMSLEKNIAMVKFYHHSAQNTVLRRTALKMKLVYYIFNINECSISTITSVVRCIFILIF